MTSKFEQLIEYVINDEDQKARELFHDIVVEKSRSIYENLMDEEDDLDESFGGDQSDELIDDVESDEQGMCAEDDEEFEGGDEFGAEEGGDEELSGDEFGAEEEGGEDLEDRVVDLEDKLDELMAEFESLMGGEEGSDGEESFDDAGDDFGAEGGDELEMDDTESFDELSENVSLARAPEPVRSEQGSINKKSTVAFNSGAAGMEGKPVKATGAAESTPDGTSANKGQDNYGKKGETTVKGAGKFQNSPNSGKKQLSPATKPHLSQATGVNTKTPFPKG